MTVTVLRRTPTRGSVLPDPLPEWVYVRTDLASFVARLVGRMSHTSVGGVHVAHKLGGCPDMPVRGAGLPWRGTEAWRRAEVWCRVCFPGGRCGKRVVDSYGNYAGLCGQPSGRGVECRWHFDLDTDVDKRMESAA